MKSLTLYLGRERGRDEFEIFHQKSGDGSNEYESLVKKPFIPDIINKLASDGWMLTATLEYVSSPPDPDDGKTYVLVARAFFYKPLEG